MEFSCCKWSYSKMNYSNQQNILCATDQKFHGLLSSMLGYTFSYDFRKAMFIKRPHKFVFTNSRTIVKKFSSSPYDSSDLIASSALQLLVKAQ